MMVSSMYKKKQNIPLNFFWLVDSSSFFSHSMRAHFSLSPFSNDDNNKCSNNQLHNNSIISMNLYYVYCIKIVNSSKRSRNMYLHLLVPMFVALFSTRFYGRRHFISFRFFHHFFFLLQLLIFLVLLERYDGASRVCNANTKHKIANFIV